MAYGENGLGTGSDVTEENRARVQKLNQQLKEAEENLQEAQYTQFIKETEQLLDTFRTDLEEFLNEKLEHLDELLEMAIEATNLNAETISNTLTEQAEAVNYQLTEEFTKIWENMLSGESPFVIGNDILASTDAVCTEIKDFVQDLPNADAMQAYFDGETLAIVSEIASVDNAVNNVETAIQDTNTALDHIKSNLAEYNSSILKAFASAQSAAEQAQKAADAAQRTANEAKSAANAAANNSSGSNNSSSSSSSDTGANYYVQVEFTDGSGHHVKTINGPFTLKQAQDKKAMYEESYSNQWGKAHATVMHYAKGGAIGKDKNPLDLIAQQLGEDHMVAAKEGERILTAKQNENFEKLANTFSSLSSEDLAKYSLFTGSKMLGKMPTLQMPTFRSMEQGGNTEINGGISINLPNVTNKAEFVEWLRNDGQIEKIIQSMTLGKLQGKNSYDKMKY